MQIGLKFMATGGMYRDIADIFNVGKSTIERTVQRFLEFVCGQYHDYAHFPNTK